MSGLGSCCICETFTEVNNIMMLDRKAPIAGKGWGCIVCRLPHDGAVAVVCDGCREFVEAGANPVYVCRGSPGTDGRTLYAELSPEPFGHDEEAHRRDDAAMRTAEEGDMNQVMQRKVDAGHAIDLSTRPRTEDGSYILESFVIGQDYCNTQRQEWIWSIGQRKDSGQLLAAHDDRFYDHPDFKCVWLR